MELMSDIELNIVIEARELLLDPDKWSRYSPALDAEGRSVKPKDPSACQWCIYGAIAKFSPAGLIPYQVLRCLDEATCLYSPELVEFCDGQVHRLNDMVFDHPMMIGFMDFLIGRQRSLRDQPP